MITAGVTIVATAGITEEPRRVYIGTVFTTDSLEYIDSLISTWHLGVELYSNMSTNPPTHPPDVRPFSDCVSIILQGKLTILGHNWSTKTPLE